MKHIAFIRCFLTQERVLANKIFNRENDSSGIMVICVRVVVDHTLPTQLQRSTKLKISHCFHHQCL